jgi:hypothetical protein
MIEMRSVVLSSLKESLTGLEPYQAPGKAPYQAPFKAGQDTTHPTILNVLTAYAFAFQMKNKNTT